MPPPPTMPATMISGPVNVNRAIDTLTNDEVTQSNKKNIVKVRAKVAQALLEGEVLPPVQDEQLTLARHLGTRYVPTQKPFSSLSCAKYLHVEHVESLAKIFQAYNLLVDGSETSAFLQMTTVKHSSGGSIAGSYHNGTSGGPVPPPPPAGRNMFTGAPPPGSSGGLAGSGTLASAGPASRVGTATSDGTPPLPLRLGQAGAGRGGSSGGYDSHQQTTGPNPSVDVTHFEPGDMAISREWFVEVLLCVIASQLEVTVPAHMLPGGGGSTGITPPASAKGVSGAPGGVPSSGRGGGGASDRLHNNNNNSMLPANPAKAFHNPQTDSSLAKTGNTGGHHNTGGSPSSAFTGTTGGIGGSSLTGGGGAPSFISSPVLGKDGQQHTVSFPPALHQTFGAPNVLHAVDEGPQQPHQNNHPNNDNDSWTRHPENYNNKQRLYLVNAEDPSTTAPPPPAAQTLPRSEVLAMYGHNNNYGGAGGAGPAESNSAGNTSAATGNNDPFMSQRQTALIRELRRQMKEQLMAKFRAELMDWIAPLCRTLDSHQLPPVWEGCDLQVKLLERFHAAARQAYQRYKQGDQLFMSNNNLSACNNHAEFMGDGGVSLSRPGTRNNASPSHASLAVPPPMRDGDGPSVSLGQNSRLGGNPGVSAAGGSRATSSRGAGLTAALPAFTSPLNATTCRRPAGGGGGRTGGYHAFADMNRLSPGSCNSPTGTGSPYSSAAGGTCGNSMTNQNTGAACLSNLLAGLNGGPGGENLTECPLLQEFLYCCCQFIIPLVPNRWEEPQPELWTSMLFFGEMGDGKASPTWMDLLRVPDRVRTIAVVHQEFPISFPQGKRRKACDRHNIVCWSDITNNLIMDFEQNRLTSNLELTYTRVPTMMLEEENRGKNPGGAVRSGDDPRRRGEKPGADDDDDDDGPGVGGGGAGRSRRALRKTGANDVTATVQSDLETFAEELKGLHSQSADKVLISTAQPSIITSSKDGVIKMWEPRWGQFASNLLNVGDAWVLGMWLLHDDQYMMVATSNAELTILEYPKGAIIQKFRGCSTLITAMRQVTQMGTTLIHRFGLRPGECGPHRTDFKSGMTPDEYRKMFREAQITTDRAVHPAKPIDGFVSPSAIYFEPSQGGMLFFGTLDGAVGCFDLTHEVKQSTILSGANTNPIHLNSAVQAHRSGVRVVGVVFCASGGYVISCGEDGSVVRISFARDITNYNEGSGIVLSNPEEIMITPRSTRLLEYCHTHRVFATAHSDRRVLMWTLGRHTAEFTHQYPQETQDIISITFLPGPKRVAFLTADRCVRLYDFRGVRPVSVIYPSRIAENNAEDVASVTLKCSMEDPDGCVAYLPESNRIVCALRGPVMYEPVKAPINGGVPGGVPTGAAAETVAKQQQASALSTIPTTIVTTASVKAGLPLLPPEDSDEENQESNESSVLSGDSVSSERIREHEARRERRAAAKAVQAAHRLQKRRLRPFTTMNKSAVAVVWKTWDVLTGKILRTVDVTECINSELPMFKRTFMTSCWWTTETRTRLMAGTREGHGITLDADHGTVVTVEKIISESKVRGELLDRDTSIVFHFKNRTFICAGRTLVVRRYIPGELRANGEEDFTFLTVKIPVKKGCPVTTITACCVIRDAHVCVGTIDAKLYFFRLIDQSTPYHEEVLYRTVQPPPPPGSAPLPPPSLEDTEIGAVVGLTFVNEVNQNLLFILLDTGVMFVYSTLRAVMLSRFLLLKPNVCRIRSFSHVRSDNIVLVGTTLGQVLVLDLSQCSSADVEFRHALRVTYCFRAATSEIVGVEYFKIPSRMLQKLRQQQDGGGDRDDGSPGASVITSPSAPSAPAVKATPGQAALVRARAAAAGGTNSATNSTAVAGGSSGDATVSAPSNNESQQQNLQASFGSNNTSLSTTNLHHRAPFSGGGRSPSFLIVASVDGNVRIFSMDSLMNAMGDGPNSPSSSRTLNNTSNATNTGNFNHRPSSSLHSPRVSSADALNLNGLSGGAGDGSNSSQQTLPLQPAISSGGSPGGLLQTGRSGRTGGGGASSVRCGGIHGPGTSFSALPYMEYLQGMASTCTTVGLFGFEEWDLLQPDSFAANSIPTFQPKPTHQTNELFLDQLLKEGKVHALAAVAAANANEKGWGANASGSPGAERSAASPGVDLEDMAGGVPHLLSAGGIEAAAGVGGGSGPMLSAESAAHAINTGVGGGSVVGVSIGSVVGAGGGMDSVSFSANASPVQPHQSGGPPHSARAAAEYYAQQQAAAAAAAAAAEYKLNFCRGKPPGRPTNPNNTGTNPNANVWGGKDEGGSASNSQTDLNDVGADARDPSALLPESISAAGQPNPRPPLSSATVSCSCAPDDLPMTIPPHDLSSVLPPTTKSLLLTIPSEERREAFASSVGPQRALKESKYKRNYLLRTYPLKWLRKIQVVPTMLDHAGDEADENIDIDADVAFSGMNVNEHVTLVAMKHRQAMQQQQTQQAPSSGGTTPGTVTPVNAGHGASTPTPTLNPGGGNSSGHTWDPPTHTGAGSGDATSPKTRAGGAPVFLTAVEEEASRAMQPATAKGTGGSGSYCDPSQQQQQEQQMVAASSGSRTGAGGGAGGSSPEMSPHAPGGLLRTRDGSSSAEVRAVAPFLDRLSTSVVVSPASIDPTFTPSVGALGSPERHSAGGTSQGHGGAHHHHHHFPKRGSRVSICDSGSLEVSQSVGAGGVSPVVSAPRPSQLQHSHSLGIGGGQPPLSTTPQQMRSVASSGHPIAQSMSLTMPGTLSSLGAGSVGATFMLNNLAAEDVAAAGGSRNTLQRRASMASLVAVERSHDGTSLLRHGASQNQLQQQQMRDASTRAVTFPGTSTAGEFGLSGSYAATSGGPGGGTEDISSSPLGLGGLPTGSSAHHYAGSVAHSGAPGGASSATSSGIGGNLTSSSMTNPPNSSIGTGAGATIGGSNNASSINANNLNNTATINSSTNVYDQLRQTPAEVLEQRRDQLMLAYMAQRLDKVRPHGHAKHEFINDVKRVWVRRAGEAQVVAETRAAALAAVNPFNTDQRANTVRHHPGIAQMTQLMNQELQRGEVGNRIEVNLNLLTIPTEARSAQEENMRLSARERLKAQLKALQKQREEEAAERHRREEQNPNPKDRRYWLPLISAKQPTHPIRITLPSTLREDDGARQQLRQLQQLVATTNASIERNAESSGAAGGIEEERSGGAEGNSSHHSSNRGGTASALRERTKERQPDNDADVAKGRITILILVFIWLFLLLFFNFLSDNTFDIDLLFSFGPYEKKMKRKDLPRWVYETLLGCKILKQSLPHTNIVEEKPIKHTEKQQNNNNNE
eukprot:gene8063-5615_t